MRKSLHVQADRHLIPTRGSSRRWLRVDVVAPRTSGTKDTRLVVDLPPGASVASPNPHRMRREGARAVFGLGPLAADQVLSLVLCVELAGGEAGDATTVELHASDPAGVLDATPVRERFEHTSASASASQPRDASVASDAARAYAARARQRASALGRGGRPEEGRAVLGRMAERLRQYAGRERAIHEIADGLGEAAARLAQSSPLELERVERTSGHLLASRGPDGAPLRTAEFVAERTARGSGGRKADEGPFSVSVVTSDGAATRLAAAAGRALAAGSPSGFGFTVADGAARVLDPGRGAVLTAEDERILAQALGARRDAVRIALVRGGLDRGAPWRWHAAEGVAFVSLDGWDDADPLARPFVAHQMALQSSRQGRDGFDPTGPPHPDSVGCWGDPDMSRTEVEAKLRAGYLCDRCRRTYEEAGIDVEAFLCYVAIVRRIAGPASRTP